MPQPFGEPRNGVWLDAPLHEEGHRYAAAPTVYQKLPDERRLKGNRRRSSVTSRGAQP